MRWTCPGLSVEDCNNIRGKIQELPTRHHSLDPEITVDKGTNIISNQSEFTMKTRRCGQHQICFCWILTALLTENTQFSVRNNAWGYDSTAPFSQIQFQSRDDCSYFFHVSFGLLDSVILYSRRYVSDCESVITYFWMGSWLTIIHFQAAEHFSGN